MTASNQCEALLKYLKTHRKGITTHVANQELGITCLWKRAKELEDFGHIITKTPLYGTNRYGNPVRVIRYALG